MTAEIFDLAKARRAASKQHASPPDTEKSDHDIFTDAFEDVIAEWQRAAERNRLNEFFKSKLPPSLAMTDTDYLSDLNMLSTIEQRLGMKVAMFYPDTMANSQIGWMSSFTLGQKVFTTPADMFSEAISRALLILLFIRFKAIMTTLGRSIQNQ